MSVWFPVYLGVLAIQRVGELIVSARHTERLRERGAREHGGSHFPWMLALHVSFPLFLAFEVFALDARPGPAWPLWLALWLVAQALRYAAVWALGERWTVKIWVLPGEPLVTRGIYRWLRHPNYVAVVLELIAAPMMFGAWRTAIVISVLNAFMLRKRIREEERALRG